MWVLVEKGVVVRSSSITGICESQQYVDHSLLERDDGACHLVAIPFEDLLEMFIEAEKEGYDIMDLTGFESSDTV